MYDRLSSKLDDEGIMKWYDSLAHVANVAEIDERYTYIESLINEMDAMELKPTLSIFSSYLKAGKTKDMKKIVESIQNSSLELPGYDLWNLFLEKLHTESEETNPAGDLSIDPEEVVSHILNTFNYLNANALLFSDSERSILAHTALGILLEHPLISASDLWSICSKNQLLGAFHWDTLKLLESLPEHPTFRRDKMAFIFSLMSIFETQMCPVFLDNMIKAYEYRPLLLRKCLQELSSVGLNEELKSNSALTKNFLHRMIRSVSHEPVYLVEALQLIDGIGQRAGLQESILDEVTFLIIARSINNKTLHWKEVNYELLVLKTELYQKGLLSDEQSSILQGVIDRTKEVCGFKDLDTVGLDTVYLLLEMFKKKYCSEKDPPNRKIVENPSDLLLPSSKLQKQDYFLLISCMDNPILIAGLIICYRMDGYYLDFDIWQRVRIQLDRMNYSPYSHVVDFHEVQIGIKKIIDFISERKGDRPLTQHEKESGRYFLGLTRHLCNEAEAYEGVTSLSDYFDTIIAIEAKNFESIKSP